MEVMCGVCGVRRGSVGKSGGRVYVVGWGRVKKGYGPGCVDNRGVC